MNEWIFQVWQAIEKVLQQDRIKDEDAGQEDCQGEDTQGEGVEERGQGEADVVELTPLAPLQTHNRPSFSKVCTSF